MRVEIASFLALATGLAGVTASPRGQEAVPPVDPPRFLGVPGTSWELRVGGRLGELRLDTLGRRMRIEWLEHGPGGELAGRRTEEHELAYWPTTARTLDGGLTLLVAGKRPADGHIVIERWDLSAPPPDRGDPAEAPFPDRPRSPCLDLEERRFGEVHVMVPLWPAARTVLAHVGGTGNLYAVDVDRGEATLLFTPREIPALERPALSTLGGDHPARGRVYVLFCSAGEGFGLPHGPLLLFDEDRDGTIDTWQDLEDEDPWETLGTPPTRTSHW